MKFKASMKISRAGSVENELFTVQVVMKLDLAF